jgi:replication factor A1
MIKVPVATIIDRIREKTSLSESEIRERIDSKLEQLYGLVSEEGAAHIIANELGVKLYEPAGKLQIKNVLSGLRNVEVVGKVIKKYEIRNFDTGQRKGRVGSFLIGDETGIIRIVLWNDMVDNFEKIKEGDIVKVKSGYVKDNNERKEIHLNDKSEILVNPAGEKVGELKQSQERVSAIRKKISELKENEDNIELFGTIVQVFDPRFFEMCPVCNKRAKLREDGFYCDEHNKVEPSYSYVMNIFLDDNFDTIRTVFWKNQMQRLLGMSHEQVLTFKDGSFEGMKQDLLGKQIKLIGRTVKNEAFDRMEFIPALVFNEPDPEEELERLKQEEKEQKPVKETKSTKETVQKSEKKETVVSSDDIETYDTEEIM